MASGARQKRYATELEKALLELFRTFSAEQVGLSMR
jgi:hypothetical protein